MKAVMLFLKKVLFLLICSVCSVLPGCARLPKHKSPQEKAIGYFWYEGVFLNDGEAERIFQETTGQFPKYEYVPYHFHVTTKFKPETKNEALYGTPVTVHII